MLTKEFIGLVSNESGLSKKETEQLLTTMNAINSEALRSFTSCGISSL